MDSGTDSVMAVETWIYLNMCVLSLIFISHVIIHGLHHNMHHCINVLLVNFTAAIISSAACNVNEGICRDTTCDCEAHLDVH